MLYNLYRPTDFASVKGQDNVLLTLRRQSLAGRFGQAYLFAGHRGTGKTTIARILSKAVNCEHPSESGPCLSCASCLAARESLDIIELDAASNNGVDKIKEMIAQAKYRPVQLKKKVFIIDEVHNLSAAAFDVLLKPLEEPPPYLVFILCTTELHKIPVTVRSRCEEYVFHPISAGPMRERLEEVLKDQGATCEEDALSLIIRSAGGGLRDALGLTEQLIVSTGGCITTQDAKKKLGVLDTDRVLELLGHAIRLDTNRALYCLAQMDRDGKSASLVVESSLDALSDLITLKSTRSEESVIHSRDYIQKLMRIADSVSFERLFWMCEQYCTLRSAIRGSIDPMMDVRLTLIRISSHDIISADPVSMAEEIGALKREVSLLKRMHAEAMEGGIGRRMAETAAAPAQPVPVVRDMAMEGFVSAGGMPLPFPEADGEEFDVSDSGMGMAIKTGGQIPAEAAGQGGSDAGKEVMAADRKEEGFPAMDDGFGQETGISNISSSDLFKILS